MLLGFVLAYGKKKEKRKFVVQRVRTFSMIFDRIWIDGGLLLLPFDPRIAFL
jgi:hypothetical protein